MMWNCKACHYGNYAHWYQCARCGEHKPPPPIEVKPAKPAPKKDEDVYADIYC